MKKLFLGVFFACILLVFGTTMTTFATETEAPYIIRDGAIYYESSDNFGSGRSGVVNEKNRYTTIPCYAEINGFAFLDQKGNILESAYRESEKDIFIPELPEGTVKIFKHFKTAAYRNGWVDSDDVLLNEVEETLDETQKEIQQNPKEIVRNINNEIQKKDEKTTIVIDFSGSMSDNQYEVVKLLETLKFNDNTKIIVFADDYEIVTQEQLSSEDFFVGAGTKMLKALNKAISMGTENLILISDLATYGDAVSLKESKNLKSVVVYDPDDGIEDSIVEDVLKVTWDQASISRIRIK